MPLRAKMHVPVELVRQGGRARWFRLSTAVSAEGLSLAHVVPEELDGPLAVAFHLPGDTVPIRCRGQAAEEIVGEGEDERAEPRAISFLDIDEEARGRISHYVNERLGLS